MINLLIACARQMALTFVMCIKTHSMDGNAALSRRESTAECEYKYTITAKHMQYAAPPCGMKICSPAFVMRKQKSRREPARFDGREDGGAGRQKKRGCQSSGFSRAERAVFSIKSHSRSAANGSRTVCCACRIRDTAAASHRASTAGSRSRFRFFTAKLMP